MNEYNKISNCLKLKSKEVVNVSNSNWIFVVILEQSLSFSEKQELSISFFVQQESSFCNVLHSISCFSIQLGTSVPIKTFPFSGLDIDALRIVANGVNKLKNKNNATIIITHYQRLLDYIVPDFVHVLHNGKIIKSGNKELALELESKGYDWITK